MHLRAYTLQTGFFYSGKSWYCKKLPSANAKLCLPLTICKSFAIWTPWQCLSQNDAPLRGSFWQKDSLLNYAIMIFNLVTIILEHPLVIFWNINFRQSRNRPLLLQLFKLFHLVPLDLYCFGDPTTTVRVIQENRKGFLFFPIFQEWTKSFCFYGLLNTFGIPGKNERINDWIIMSKMTAK